MLSLLLDLPALGYGILSAIASVRGCFIQLIWPDQEPLSLSEIFLASSVLGGMYTNHFPSGKGNDLVSSHRAFTEVSISLGLRQKSAN